MQARFSPSWLARYQALGLRRRRCRAAFLISLVAMGALCGACPREIGALTFADSRDGPESTPDPAPALTMQQAMQEIVMPPSIILFAAAATTPADEEGWDKARFAALNLSDIGLTFLPRVGPKDDDEWLDYSDAMFEAASKASSAAIDRDKERFKSETGLVRMVCESCHLKYAKSHIRIP